MSDERRTPDGPDDPEVVSDEEWAEQDDDPQGMRGQLDDSMNGLEAGDDADEAARGISQADEAVQDEGPRPDAGEEET